MSCQFFGNSGKESGAKKGEELLFFPEKPIRVTKFGVIFNYQFYASEFLNYILKIILIKHNHILIQDYTNS